MTRRGQASPTDFPADVDGASVGSRRHGPSTGAIRPAPLVVAAVAALVLLVLLAGRAQGHATLVGTDPPDAGVVATPPREIRLEFSEAVIARLTSIEVENDRGEVVPLGPVRADPADASAVVVGVPDLPPSAYRATWRAVSADDLHVTQGILVFGVGVAPAGSVQPAADPLPGPLEVAIRWLDLAALAVLVGSLLVAEVVLGPLRRRPSGSAGSELDLAAGRVRRLAAAGGGLALVTGVALLVVEAGTVATAAGGLLGAASTILTSTAGGAWWLVREAACAGLLVVAIAGRRPAAGHHGPRRRVARIAATGLATGALVVAIAAGSHVAEAGPLSVPALALAVHLLAAAAWTGGLAALALASLPLLRGPAPAPATARTVLRRFGGLAATSVAALAVTGLLASGSVVASPDALLLTPYGQGLLAKGALFGVVALIGLGHALGLHPSLRRSLRFAGRLRRPLTWPRIGASLGAEIAGGLTILALAAFVGSTAPARGPAWDPAPAAPLNAAPVPAVAADVIQAAAKGIVAPVSANADDLVVTVAIRPDRPGPNFVDVSVHDTRRPAPAPIAALAVHLVTPDGIDQPALVLRDLGAGQYEASVADLAAAGSWSVAVDVERAGLRPAAARVPWTVLAGSPPNVATVATVRHTVLLSDQPLAPMTNAVALLLGLGAAGAGFAVWRRTRRAGARTLGPTPRLDPGRDHPRTAGPESLEPT